MSGELGEVSWEGWGCMVEICTINILFYGFIKVFIIDFSYWFHLGRGWVGWYVETVFFCVKGNFDSVYLIERR